MIYSFLGWAMESAYVSINAKKWVNRGFINGPFCPIYGTGALLILLALEPVSDSILLLFLGGFVIATVVEYLIGLILEKLFHATWWDYSQKPFNIKGRVCLERSVEWGVLTAFVMRVVQPVIADFVAAIPRAWGEFAATLLLAYLAVDTTITVLHILRFNEKLASLSEAHDALQKKLEGTRLYASRQEIITRFESMPAAEFLREFKERMAEENERLEQLREEFGFYAQRLLTFQYEGESGAAKMADIMRKLRAPLDTFQDAHFPTATRIDYQNDETGLPKSDVLSFALADGSKIIVRPSGTEPKLKAYLFARGENQAAAEKVLDELETLMNGYCKE